jgi:hypothetical protein
LEAVYRLQPFGFYSRELKAFNSKDDLAGPGNRATVLIFGDSFTVVNENHANVLRATLPNLRIINSGIPGTGLFRPHCRPAVPTVGPPAAGKKETPRRPRTPRKEDATGSVPLPLIAILPQAQNIVNHNLTNTTFSISVFTPWSLCTYNSARL